MTKSNIVEGHRWTDAGYFDTYELARAKADKIKQDDLQTKIRRRSSGKFLVKYRKDPSLVTEEKKNGKKSRKSRKRDTIKREPKFNAASI